MLPATEAEVNLLQNLLRANQWQANVFTLEHATEENLKKVSSPVLLHVATHGFFLSDVDIDHSISSDENSFAQNPLLRSGILLAGAGVAQGTGGEDGVLTAYEAMNLNLDQTELVSLSACETGLGEVRNGEGVYGLQRSFLVAGARSLLMSLWQVDDAATQELMTSFYSLWMAGQPKIEAFRKAQQEIKNKYEAPYFWGAFVLIGR
jgi:CHAT domain-containing protein